MTITPVDAPRRQGPDPAGEREIARSEFHARILGQNRLCRRQRDSPDVNFRLYRPLRGHGTSAQQDAPAEGARQPAEELQHLGSRHPHSEIRRELLSRRSHQGRPRFGEDRQRVADLDGVAATVKPFCST